MEKIEIYDNLMLQTPEGQIETNRIKLFVPLSAIGKDGSIEVASVGNQLVERERGFTFIVDKHVSEQFEKLRIGMEGFEPYLYIKEGEQLENGKSPEEIEIEKLQQELALKQAELNAKIAPQ